MLFSFLLLLTQIVADYTPQDYCNLPCYIGNKSIPNAICKNKCKQNDSCKNTNFGELQFSNSDRYYILTWHNLYRHRYAIGKENNITVANMMVLSYDQELENIAMCLAKKCNEEVDFCKRSFKFGNIGQNEFQLIHITKSELDNKLLIQMGIQFWFDEYKHLRDGVKKVFDEKKMFAKSFSQMIWAKTRYVGCGGVHYEVDKKVFYKLICNYGQEGNLNGKEIYLEGNPGSRCPKGFKRNLVLNGLCGTNLKSGSYEFVDEYKEFVKIRANSPKNHGYKTLFVLIYFIIRCI
nr:venom allergen 5-like [Onthophagus taurus]